MAKSKQTPDPKALDILVSLGLGEIEVDNAARLLGQTEEEFIGFVESNPDLTREAEAVVKRQRLDPEHTLEKSNAGLAAAISVLATRIENHGSDMATAELVQASSLLEKLLAFSEQRKAEVKGNGPAADKEAPKVPVYLQDFRPCPVTGKARLRLILVLPDSPRWYDPSEQVFRDFDWLNTHMPLSPETGDILNLDDLLADAGIRFMDERGRVHGGHL